MDKLNKIYKRKSELFGMVYVCIKDMAMTEDILQDTFIKIWLALESGNYVDDNLMGWAARVAKHTMIDHLRRAKKERIMPLGAMYWEPSHEIVTFKEDKAALKKRNNEILIEMINELPSDFRETLALHYYFELPFKAIAQLTNVSINTALGRARYGLSNLRKMIK